MGVDPQGGVLLSSNVFQSAVIRGVKEHGRDRADAVPGQQRVQVYADDSLAGDWYMPDGNYTNLNKRWVDSEFLIAEQLVGELTRRWARAEASVEVGQELLLNRRLR